LDKKRLLAAKEILSEQEKKDLALLTQELGALDATVTFRDPLYARFVEAMTVLGYKRDAFSATLTDEQRETQRRLATEVLEGMKIKEHAVH